MSQEDQQILEQISSIWKKVDTFLVNHDNSLLLFDFTTVSHFENSDEKRIKSIYQYKIKNYKNLFPIISGQKKLVYLFGLMMKFHELKLP